MSCGCGMNCVILYVGVGMNCVILYRAKSGHVLVVHDVDENIRIFPDRDAAILYCDGFKGGTDYQIVELDEL